jgi:hypothetical protein
MAASSLVIIDQVPGITGFDAQARMFHLLPHRLYESLAGPFQ